ncbi:MAG: hypothetical protein WEB88_01160 [Gemmatimonadota bacterium]
MTQRQGSAFVLGISMAGAACGLTDADRRTAGFEVRDSAGIEIVFNAQPEHALAVQEVLRIGVVDGDPDYQFQGIWDIAVDSAGGIWVVDAAESVRRYGPDGRLTTRVGARGSGPGEAPQGWGSIVLGAGGVVLEAGSSIQLFGADGAFLSSWSSFLGDIYMSPIGRADGRWILQAIDYSGSPGVWRAGVSVFAGATPAEAVDTVGVFPGQVMRSLGTAAGPGPAGAGPYFMGDPHFAVDGRGHLFVSDTLAYRVERYGTDGALQRVLTRAAEPVPYDPAWIAAMEAPLEAYLGRSGSIDRAAVERLMERARPDPEPPHLHFIQDLFVGRNGALWIERADRYPDPPTRAAAHQIGIVPAAWPEAWRAPRVFDVFDANGKYQGTVNLPATFTPMAVAGTAIYGVMRDDLDVEFVVAFTAGAEEP